MSAPDRWTVAEAGGKAHFTEPLGPARIAALDKAIAWTSGSDVNDPDFGRSPEIREFLRPHFTDLADRLLDGDGIAILSGFPVRDWPEAKLARAFRLIGATLGHGVSQSRLGDRLGRVTDVSGTNPDERGYRTSRELRLHTDANDIVGLLAVRTARAGGHSRLANALAVHDAMAARAPDRLRELVQGFPYHWRGEQPDGEPPITDYRIPVFSEVDGKVSTVYLSEHITWAAEEGHPFTALQKAALQMFEELANSPDYCMEFDLAEGDGLFFNNLTTLHSRTSYEDHDDPAEKRLLLRLWIRADRSRPVVDAIRRFYPPDGIEPRADQGTIFKRTAERDVSPG
ncbi:MAG: TauD/TfdA family dioxygenase [Rhodospirillales bacterium]